MVTRDLAIIELALQAAEEMLAEGKEQLRLLLVALDEREADLMLWEDTLAGRNAEERKAKLVLAKRADATTKELRKTESRLRAVVAKAEGLVMARTREWRWAMQLLALQEARLRARAAGVPREEIGA